ncbi:hypothetical protein BN1002_02942 [Bacillus sp. B-jedd]|nr:hypothetical protein BN1002_02942 [Bacillus sp. B-jedd]
MTIKIDYYASMNVSMAGNFPLQGKSPVTIAWQWWREIKKNSHNAKIIKVTVNDTEDITDLIKSFEAAPLPAENLPF